MAHNIQHIDDRHFKINGKLIYKDMNDNWNTSTSNISDNERIAMNDVIAEIERGSITDKPTPKDYPPVKEIFFEDNGQLFLHWVLDRKGNVLLSLPKGTQQFKGFKVKSSDVRLGNFLPTTDKDLHTTVITYRVDSFIRFE